MLSKRKGYVGISSISNSKLDRKRVVTIKSTCQTLNRGKKEEDSQYLVYTDKSRIDYSID